MTMVRRQMETKIQMGEKRYDQLVAGDCVWYNGAFVRITQVFPPRGLVRDLQGTVVRAGGGWDAGEVAAFSGLEYATILVATEPMP